MNSGIDVKIFSPSEPLGIFIIFLGLIFSAIILYILYFVSTNKESIDDKKINAKKDLLQQKKIEKLYPKKK